MDAPSLALTSANLVTLDAKHPAGDTLLVRGERIAVLGWAADLRPEIAAARQVVDLHGRTVLPGFIDAHVHMIGTGLAHFAVDLTEARTLDQALDSLRRAAGEGRAGEWVVGQGLAAGLLEGAVRRLPTRQELDSLAPHRPLFVGERTGHACSANSLGLERLAVPPDLPGQERDGGGQPAGILSAEANTLASARLDEAFAEQIGYGQIVEAACREALAAGLTTIHALDGTQASDDPGVRALLEHGERAAPRVLVYYQTRDVQAALRLGLPRIGGCGACWVDGAFTPHTARLLEPYHDRPQERGSLYFSDGELLQFFRAAHRSGLQISVHCVGDGAVEQALGAFEAALGEPSPAGAEGSNRIPGGPHRHRRHRIEHAELITPEQLRRARRLGLALCIQPAFNHYWRHDRFYPRLLGEERAGRVDPVRSLVQAGLLVGGGSDSTVTPMRPLLGVHAAVNHSNPAERIDPEQALRLFTLGAAGLAFEEQDKGSLSPGKLADLAVLEANPLEVGPFELKDIPVWMTVVGGEVMYSAG